MGRRLWSDRYASSLDDFASVAWVLGRFDTGYDDACVDARFNPRACFHPWSRGSLDFWSMKMTRLCSMMLAD